MPTFLFDKIIFGPVKSRRLGVSLGINLLPTKAKICNYDCIYCECGWNEKIPKPALPSREVVKKTLGEKLVEMALKGQAPDVITFAGNGEPTMHPDFEGIMEDTDLLRSKYCPRAGIAVLSNATLIHKPSVARGLQRADQNILKLDTVIEKSFRLINKPSPGISLSNILNSLISFQGEVIIQTLFFKGEFGGVKIDNTTEIELSGLVSAYKKIKPVKIMIYTFERDTAAEGLEKIPLPDLLSIAGRLGDEGFQVEVSS